MDKPKLQRQAIRLGAAWFDFDMVEKVAQKALFHLRRFSQRGKELLPVTRDPTLYALQTTCVIAYARPFTDNTGLGALGRSLTRYSSSETQQFHADLMRLRHGFFAHSDIALRPIQVHPNKSESHIRGPGTTGRFSLSQSGIRLEERHYALLKKMCAERKGIVWPQLQRILAELYPSPGEPYGPVLLNLEVQLSQGT